MLPRMHDSPMPMNSTSGEDSDTATAPTDELLIRPSVTGAHRAPASVVFQSPPPVAPKYASRGRPLTPETAIERPPRSGPMLRHLKAASSSSRPPLALGADCAASSRRAAGLKAADTASNAAQARNVRCLNRAIMTRSLQRKKPVYHRAS